MHLCCKDVLDIKDLKVGQKLEGVVRNVKISVHSLILDSRSTSFISHMSRKFIKHPSQVVSVGDLVTV